MNIFYTSNDIPTCASDHCTVHMRKMILEYAQLLSTAIRVYEGKPMTVYVHTAGKLVKKEILFMASIDTIEIEHGLPVLVSSKLFQATHINHPSAIWVREVNGNYIWLWNLLSCLCGLYEVKYNKKHSIFPVVVDLCRLPTGIPAGVTPIPQCMPDEFRSDDTIQSYKNYLNSKYINWTTRTDKRKMKVDWVLAKPEWAII